MARPRKRGRRAAGIEKSVTQPQPVEECEGVPQSNERVVTKRERASSSKKSGRISASKTLATPLVEREELSREDVKCPICWSILLEPTTLPCNHSMCSGCFKKHIEDNAVCCPCCRLRVSVWARNTMKHNKLLDQRLWQKIQAKFPKLAEARTLGLDTQNIMEDFELSEEEEDIKPDLCSSVLDGTLIIEHGSVKQEYDSLYEQHQKDLELERLREETASTSLIQKIQEEEEEHRSQEREIMEHDFKMAQKIQEDLKAESQETFQLKKTPRRNLMEEWVASTCRESRTPQTKSSQSKKLNSSKKGKGKRSQQNKSAKSDISRASQDFMSNYLLSQDSQLFFEPETDFNSFDTADKPCCSNSIEVHDVHYSAFSPTKASNRCNILIPSADLLALQLPSMSEGTTIVSQSQTSKSAASTSSEESSTCPRSPDSIKSEIDRHFRPIRSAPKTPPRRRPDGTFLPEPKLIKMTPVKAPPSSTFPHCGETPSKQAASSETLPSYKTFGFESATKPSSATVEKRISNDSGRASEIEPRSPCVDQNNSDLNDRGCSSDDYRVTPDDTITLENAKKKRMSEQEGDNDADLLSKRVKAELEDEDNKNNLDLPDLKLLVKQEPSTQVKLEIECSQGVIVIDDEDEDYLEKETEELEKFRQKKEQEEADRAFARKLQRELQAQDRKLREQGQTSKDRYSLRSWFKPEGTPRQTRNSAVRK